MLAMILHIFQEIEGYPLLFQACYPIISLLFHKHLLLLHTSLDDERLYIPMV